MIVPLIERGVGLDERKRGAERDADASAFGEHIMLEPAGQPDTRRFLDDDDAQTQLPWCWRGPFQLGRKSRFRRGRPLVRLRHATDAAIRLTAGTTQQ